MAIFRTLFVLVGIIVTAASLSAQTTYYVRDGGSGTQDGTSEANAAATLDDDDIIAVLEDGDVIDVGPGTFDPATFGVGVHIAGNNAGYANWGQDPTVLGTITLNGEVEQTVTFEGVQWNVGVPVQVTVNNTNAIVTIANCRFTGSSKIDATRTDNRWKELYINDCQFDGDETAASAVGAVNLDIVNLGENTFSNYTGSAVVFEGASGSSITIDYNSFTDNTGASTDGAVSFKANAGITTAKIQNNIFNNNYNGVVISSGTVPSTLTVQYNKFTNTASGYYAVKNSGSGTLTATCNNYGTDNLSDRPGSTVRSLLSGSVTALPYNLDGVDDNGGDIGFEPAANSCTKGGPVASSTTQGSGASYFTISEAIAASASGAEVKISKDNYNENLTISKRITLQTYSNDGFAAYDTSDARDKAESDFAELTGTITISAAADNVKISGLHIKSPGSGNAANLITSNATGYTNIVNCWLDVDPSGTFSTVPTNGAVHVVRSGALYMNYNRVTRPSSNEFMRAVTFAAGNGSRKVSLTANTFAGTVQLSGLSALSDVTIDGNLIQYAGIDGVSVTGNYVRTLDLSDNTIEDAQQNGIAWRNGSSVGTAGANSANVINNLITGSGQIGSGYAAINIGAATTGTQKFNNNSIPVQYDGNKSFINSRSSYTPNVTCNWWGSLSQDDIEEQISPAYPATTVGYDNGSNGWLSSGDNFKPAGQNGFEPHGTCTVRWFLLDADKTNISCNGASDGSVTASLDETYDNPDFTYSWSLLGSTQGSTQTLTGRSDGEYTVTVTSSNGNYRVKSTTVYEPTPVYASVDFVHIACNGSSSGSITVTEPGGGIHDEIISGSRSYSYKINDGSGDVSNTTGSFTGLATGTYDVYVIAEEYNSSNPECEKWLQNVSIEEPSSLSATTVSKSNISCSTEDDGQITVTGSGGTHPAIDSRSYSYKIVSSILPGDGEVTGSGTSFTFTGLSDGTYEVFVSALSDDGSDGGDVPACNDFSKGVQTIYRPSAVSNNPAAGWIYNADNGHYYKLTSSPLLFYTAKATAQSLGGYLATVTSETENNFIKDYFTSTGNVWLGASDEVVDGDWRWLGGPEENQQFWQGQFDGAPVGSSYSNWNGEEDDYGDWNQNEPNNYGEGAAFLVMYNSGLWNDAGQGGWNRGVIERNEEPTPSTQISYTHVSCEDSNDGTITVVGDGGTHDDAVTRTYSYKLYSSAIDEYYYGDYLSGSGATHTFYNLTDGTYDVYVSADAVGEENPACEVFLGNITIRRPSPVTPGTLSKSNISCNGSTDGSITVPAATGGTHSGTSATRTFTYRTIKSGGGYDVTLQSAGTFTGLTPGTYTVLVTASNEGTTVPECRQQYYGPVVIYEPSDLELPSGGGGAISKTNITCHGVVDGTITVTGISGGTHGDAPSRNFTYRATNTVTSEPFNSSTSTISGLSAGTYDVVVIADEDVDGSTTSPSCQISAGQVVIYEPNPVTTWSLSHSNISCNASTDGVITVIGTGGTHTDAPSRSYTYYLTSGGSTIGPNTTGSFTGLDEGEYAVYVSADADGAENPACSDQFQAEINIYRPDAITLGAISKANVSCNGEDDATITVESASSGWFEAVTGSRSFSYRAVKSGGGYDETLTEAGTFTGLEPGTYTVSVIGASDGAANAPGCTKEYADPIVIYEPTALAIGTPTKTNISCNSATDGTITVVGFSGGTHDETAGRTFTYKATPTVGDPVTSTTTTITGLTDGTYTISVEADAQPTNPMCSITAVSTVVINRPSPVGNGGDPAAGWVLNPDNGHYYKLTETSMCFTAAKAAAEAEGGYLATITSAEENNFIRDNVRVWVVYIGGTDLDEEGAWKWNGGPENGQQFWSGGENGNAVGGYYTNWTGGEPSGQVGWGEDYLVMLESGKWNDGTACSLRGVIERNSEPGKVYTHISCNGATDGTITVTGTGGTHADAETRSYSYKIISDGLAEPGYLTGTGTSHTFTGLDAGTYEVYMSALADGDEIPACTEVYQGTITIERPSEISLGSLSKTNISCNGSTDGAISVAPATGGTHPAAASRTYSYRAVKSTGGTTVSSTSSITGLSAGTYTVVVVATSDGSNLPECSKEYPDQVVIYEPSALGIGTPTKTNITCFEAGNGTITVTGISGGTHHDAEERSFTYRATNTSTDDEYSSSTSTITGLPAGTYDVDVYANESSADLGATTNPQSCTVSAGQVVIYEPSPVGTSSLTHTHISCNDTYDGDGTITVTGSGGTHNDADPRSYSYHLTSGESTYGPNTTGAFTGLNEGTYAVYVTADAAGSETPACSDQYQATITILRPSEIILGSWSKTNISCNGGTDGSITVTSASGGSHPGEDDRTFQYRVSGPGGYDVTLTEPGTFTGLGAGNYTVSAIATSDGTTIPECVKSTTIQVYEPSALVTADGGWYHNPDNGHYYKLTEPLDFYAAKSAAEAVGGYLATITTADENTRVVENLLQNQDYVWLGGSDQSVEGEWRWLGGPEEGELLDYTNWDAGHDEPNGATYENYLMVYGGFNPWEGSWNDAGPGAIIPGVIERNTNPAGELNSLSHTNITCENSDNGTITVTGISGATHGDASTRTYTYRVTRQGGEDPPYIRYNQPGENVISGLEPGTYDVDVYADASTIGDYITNPQSCLTSVGQVVIYEPSAIGTTDLDYTHIACATGNTGTITVAASGGTHDEASEREYEYSVFLDGSLIALETNTTGSFTGLDAGTYDVRVTAQSEGDGVTLACSGVSVGEIEIKRPSDIELGTITKNNISCNGSTNGTITVADATGGSHVGLDDRSFHYNLIGPGGYNETLNSSGTFTGLAAGSYTVTAIATSDGPHVVQCEKSSSTIVIYEPTAITLPSSPAEYALQFIGSTEGVDDRTVNGSFGPGAFQTAGWKYGVFGGWFADEGAGVDPTVVSFYDANGANPIDVEITLNFNGGGTGDYIGATGGSDLTRMYASGILTDNGSTTLRVLAADLPFETFDVLLYVTDDLDPGDIDPSYSVNGNEPAAYSNGSFNETNTKYFPNISNADDLMIDVFNGIIHGFEIVNAGAVTDPITKTNIACEGNTNGAISIVTPTGGTHDENLTRTYDYYINGVAGEALGTWERNSTGDFTGLPAGTYEISLIANESGNSPECSTPLEQTVVINEPTALASTITYSHISCAAATDGEITIIGSGGTHVDADPRDYMYMISMSGMDNVTNSTGSFTGLEAGTYTVSMKALAAGSENPECDYQSQGTVVVERPTAVIADVNNTHVTCFGGNDGTLTIDEVGGGDHYQSEPRSYSYHVVAIDDEDNEFDQSNTTGSFTGLVAGTYSVSVTVAQQEMTDPNTYLVPECVTTFSNVVVYQPGLLEATVSVKKHASCSDSEDGELEVSSPTGGTRPGIEEQTYEYKLIDAGMADIDGQVYQTATVFTGLPPGGYHMMMRAVGVTPVCERAITNDPIQIIGPGDPVTADIEKTNVTCSGSTNGSIVVSNPAGAQSDASGPRSYEYRIVKNGTTTTGPQTSGSFTGLSAGTYAVYVTAIEMEPNIPACDKLVSTEYIYEPSDVVSMTSKVNISKNGLTDGQVAFTAATGGVHSSGDVSSRSYSYYIVKDDGESAFAGPQSSLSFSGLGAGTYTTFVIAAEEVSGPPVPPSSGTRTFVTPACTTQVATHVIYEPSVVTADVASANVACITEVNGTVTVSNADGGEHDDDGARVYTYRTLKSSVDGPSFDETNSTGSFTGLSAGTYTVSVIAAESGEGVNPESTTDITTSLVIYEPNGVGVASMGSQNPTCNGGTNGTITVVGASGGMHDGVIEESRTYRYYIELNGSSHAGPQSSAEFTGLGAGTYGVFVTVLESSNGTMTNPECTGTFVGEVILTEPDPLEFTFTDDANQSAPYKKTNDNVTFSVTVTGGTPPYTYEWKSKPATQSSYPTEVEAEGGATFTFRLENVDPDLVTGSYTIGVSDAFSCPSADGDQTTRVNAYVLTDLYVNNNTVFHVTDNPYAGSDETGTGSSSRPLSTINSAVAVASSGETVNIMQPETGATALGTGEGDYGPEVTKNVTFKRVDNRSPSLQISIAPEWAGTKSFVIATSSCTFSGFSPSRLYVKDGDADVSVCAGDLQFAINSVASAGTVTLLPGEWLVASPLVINKAITIEGLEPSNLASVSCDLNPTTQLSSAGTTKTMIFQGPLEKTVRNLVMRAGQSISAGTTTTGRFFETQAGSSGNVNVSNMIFKHHRAQAAEDTVRLYGLTNGQFSGGAIFDVAKFVNDADDNAGFGTGRVLFGIQGPLPWQILDIGWKAEDCGTTVDGTLVTNMNSMTTRNTNQLRATTATRPKVRTGANGINGRAALEFVGNTRVMSATPNASIMTGTQKTVFAVFKTPDVNLAGADRQVIYKQGDHLTGLSIVLSGNTDGTTDLIMSFYNCSDGTVGTLQTATNTFGSVELNKVYMAQMYFNGNGTNNATRRTGFSLQAVGSSSGTQVYKTAAQYPVTTIYQHPSYSTGQSISLGARVGNVRYGTETNTTAGVSLYFGKGQNASAGLVSEVLVFGTASENVRDAAYCYLRNKYMGDNSWDNDLEKNVPDQTVLAGDEELLEEVDVYPNPAESEVTVTVSVRQAGPLKVEIVDALGRVVGTVFDGLATQNLVLPVGVDVSKFTSGAYVVRAVGAGDFNISQPFIIRR
jgi:uncharacterized protein (DUF2141 family)